MSDRFHGVDSDSHVPYAAREVRYDDIQAKSIAVPAGLVARVTICIQSALQANRIRLHIPTRARIVIPIVVVVIRYLPSTLSSRLI